MASRERVRGESCLNGRHGFAPKSAPVNYVDTVDFAVIPPLDR